ncbi:acyltransferase [Chryseobacterium sp. NKUCC03_KSP]|uniref:acyltransferase family protein n=1 Tax=Chryseobacterium sp. NKUCC03_KSP TaxID=2842125 RepID=UPI001C5B0665|nr:acyltransferase [Chryseobacterium sp. NKUCC03_KSP]MBW3524439.1 acyltransferase [Chryseobacterium sp. NKUCC03_KSP]
MKIHIDKKNNYDFLRLFFASLVIIGHSFPLSGIASHDPIYFCSNGQINLGTLSVGAFFSISGFLMIGSLNRSKNILDYLWKRIIRLYPGLIAVLVITLILVVIINPNVIESRSFWTYFPNSILLYGNQYTIDGIFETNPYKKIVNGSLWTLCYEFTCYIFLILLISFRKNIHLQEIIIFFTLITTLILYNTTNNFSIINLSSKELFRFSSYFFAGAFLYYHKSFLKKVNILVISIILIVISLFLVFFDWVFPLVTYVILSVGLKSTRFINHISDKIGDLSYGVYIYGFLIQQTLMYYFKLDVFSLIFISLALSFIFGFVSWKYVEKPALEFKNMFSK